MKYYIIAGEASGDLHGSNLVQQLARLDNNASFKGIGGEKLKHSGVDILFGLERLAFMGFYEVLRNLRTIRKNFKEVKNDILHFQPDVIILIDYPGFNLRMAKWCKQQGFKVVYYISPKFWAWKENRVENIKKYVDLMLCILPFEKAFYEKHQYPNAHFVGHPLLDEVELQRPSERRVESVQPIALLPGSRKQEITTLLPPMLETAIRFPNEQFMITGISGLKELYPALLPQNVTIVFGETYKVLQNAKAAIVCSGTATLETALFNVPQVVVYKTTWLNYQLGKRLIKVKFISLPNLIADEKIVEELIQQDCTAENIAAELNKLLLVVSQEFYHPLFDKIGEKGASKKAAKLIVDDFRILNTDEIVDILLIIKEKITDESDLMWKSYETASELRKEIDNCMAALKNNDKNILTEIHVYFAPTGVFQEHSIQNGWSDEYLVLAKKIDSLIIYDLRD